MNYLVGDVIIRIKNAVMANRRQVVLPYSKITLEIGRILTKEKYISQVKEEEIEGKKVITATLLYDKRIPFFTDAKIISKPSLRVYAKASDAVKLRGRGLGQTIVSTSKGIMTGEEAFKNKVGGELLFRVW
jgi:small subunit ribosomal protein S8